MSNPFSAFLARRDETPYMALKNSPLKVLNGTCPIDWRKGEVPIIAKKIFIEGMKERCGKDHRSNRSHRKEPVCEEWGKKKA
jgi:hypothetical protein